MTTEFTYEGTQEVVLAGNVQLTVGYAADVEVQYDPGRTSGPPESCYPPSGDVTFNAQRLVSVKDEDGNEIAIDPHAHGRILAQVDWQAVEQSVWDKFFTEYYGQDDWLEDATE